MHLIHNGHRYYDMRTIGKSLNSDGIVEKIDHICYHCRGLVLLGFSAASSSIFLNTCTSSYNVLHIYLDIKKNTCHLGLLDRGGQSNDLCHNTDLSWKTLNISEFENVSTHQRYYSKYCMSTEGSILYILTSPYAGSTKLKITCVDIVTLTCTTLDMPVTLSLHWTLIRFQLWRGHPSVVYILENKLNVLALEDYKTEKWADTVVFPLFFMKKAYMTIPYLLIYTDGTEDILWYSEDIFTPRCSVYKLESKVRCHIPFLPWKVPATLVSIKGMQPQKKEPRLKLYA